MRRLQREDWIRAALQALATYGVAGVRVEVLARDLGVSKGSFYWHFADRPALLEALFTTWEAASDGLIAEARRAPDPQERLARLLTLLAAPERGQVHLSDAALFLWARQERQIAARIAAVERRRTAFVAEQLCALGLAPAEAEQRAAFATAAFNGFVEQWTRDAAALSVADFQAIVTCLLAPDPPVGAGTSPSHHEPSRTVCAHSEGR